MAQAPGSSDDARPEVGRLGGACTPDLSVIVVTHNRAALAVETLLRARDAAESLVVEWLVVDSGSTDGTPDAIERSFPDVSVRRLANVGFAAANNLALADARGRYVLLLNPDCIVASGTFGSLVAELDAQPSIGIASVIQQAPDGSLQHSIRHYPSVRLALAEAVGASRWRPLSGLREEVCDEAGYRSSRSCDWLVGAFLIARREAIAQVGPLDERFFLYSEETDWCYRFRRAGWDVRHTPAMVVTHHTASTRSPDLAAQLSYAKVLFARKHYGPLRSSLIRQALALRHLVRALACAATGRSRRANADAAARGAAERRALAVMRGRVDPPFGGPRLAARRVAHREAAR